MTHKTMAMLMMPSSALNQRNSSDASPDASSARSNRLRNAYQTALRPISATSTSANAGTCSAAKETDVAVHTAETKTASTSAQPCSLPRQRVNSASINST